MCCKFPVFRPIFSRNLLTWLFKAMYCDNALCQAIRQKIASLWMN